MKLKILIGPMGSGKSTFAKTFCEETGAVLINQDSQGKEGHLSAFKKALEEKKEIVVDRCNFDRQQREIYSKPAEELGYEISYKYFFLPYEQCLDNVLKRESHPTIKNNDIATAKKALDFYFKTESMSDIWNQIQYKPFRNTKFADLTVLCQYFKRIIVISDPHGCYNEMMNLLDQVKYDSKNDVLIIAGDLSDRGPDSDKIIRFAMSHNVYCLRGNHDFKLLRWLRGNDVNTKSIQLTIDQLRNSGMIEGSKRDELYNWMMNMPEIIKVGKAYIAHAGFNPNVHPEQTKSEFTMFARYFDPKTGTFTRDATCPYWYDVPRKHPEYNLLFGHIVTEEFKVFQDNIYPLDGGACFGEKMRCVILNPMGDFQEMVEVDSDMPKRTKQDDEWDYQNKFEPYDKLVELGYLRRVEKGDLVLYNYTDKCTYDRHWNKYTMECRGLILNKETGDTVARPFAKFFNLTELDNKELPQPPVGEDFVVEEKLDGSLGIQYFDPADKKHKIATRGSFESMQAIKGTEMLNKAYQKLSEADFEFLSKVTDEYTLLFEIIYPENRFNDGARLVVDYGSEETLVLLAAINKVSGRDLVGGLLNATAKILGFPLRKEYKYTLEELKALQKTWPVNFEGVVVRFIPSNFRTKLKGDEYCKMQRILNSISPLSIWEKMSDGDAFVLSSEYLMLIPEEIRPEVEDIEAKLLDSYEKTMDSIYAEFTKFLEKYPALERTPKNLGLYTQEKAKQDPDFRRYASGMFLIYNNQTDKLRKHVIKIIRPTSNVLGE